MRRGPDNGMLIVVCALVFLGGLVLSFALVHPDLGSGSTVTSVVLARGGGRVTTPTYAVPTGTFTTTTSASAFTPTTDTSTGPPIVTSPTTAATSVVTITQPETITSVITSPGQAQTSTVVSTVTITTTKTQTTTGSTTTTTQTTQTTQTRPTDSKAARGLVVFKDAKPACGGCHTFTPAGSIGSKGPNLDNLKSLWATARRPDGSLLGFIQLSITFPASIPPVPGFPKNGMPVYAASAFKGSQLNDLVHLLYVYSK